MWAGGGLLVSMSPDFYELERIRLRGELDGLRARLNEVSFQNKTLLATLDQLTEHIGQLEGICADALEDSAMYQRGLAEGRKEAAEEIERLREQIEDHRYYAGATNTRASGDNG